MCVCLDAEVWEAVYGSRVSAAKPSGVYSVSVQYSDPTLLSLTVLTITLTDVDCNASKFRTVNDDGDECLCVVGGPTSSLLN